LTSQQNNPIVTHGGGHLSDEMFDSTSTFQQRPPPTSTPRHTQLPVIALLAPDVHIFTSTKQPWVEIPAGVPAFAEYYQPDLLWPEHTKQRFAALKAQRR
jgi:hypothetical protein